MSLLLRTFLVVAAWWFAFPTASRIGDAWHLQAHPHKGVTITLPGGRTLQGALSRHWDGTWFLIDEAGRSVHVSMEYASLSGPARMAGETWTPNIPVRQMLPVLALTLLALVAAVLPGRVATSRSAQRSPASTFSETPKA